MRRILAMTAVALLMIIAACSTDQGNLVTDSGAPHYTTFAEAKAAATSGNKAILVDFYTDW
ncbi:MAG: hypothetical protein P1R58_06975 [bacterium]|nr:hypothetical protein [bacterium]